jgi:S1-C subfamily serine protease
LLGVKITAAAIPERGGGSAPAVQIAAVQPGSFLGRIGARPGDVIRQLDDQSIASLSDFRTAIVRYHDKSSMVLMLQRGNQRYAITVEL